MIRYDLSAEIKINHICPKNIKYSGQIYEVIMNIIPGITVMADNL
jgi:hypothetical protein